MKIKTVVISVVVSAALIAGAGYGAYYAMQGKKSPVEVVPVSNVNNGGFWGMTDSIYGTVTSQIAQNITLDEEYSIAEIYVEEGDQVKEGTPLFAYDMTLPELELEMEKLNQQVNELTMTKLEKDLEKLKSTPATAALEHNPFSMTTASNETMIVENPAENEDSSFVEAENETEGTTENTESESVAEQTDGIQVEKIEAVEGEEDPEKLAILNCVTTYEKVVAAIDSLFKAYGDELVAADVEDAITEAYEYYLKHLAEEKIETAVLEDGTTEEQTVYVLREDVRAALDEDGIKVLEECSELLELYQTKCQEMQKAEAAAADLQALENESELQNGEGQTNPQTDEMQTEPQTGGQSEIQTEKQSETSSESETEKYYTVQVQEPGSANMASAAAGDIVVLHTDATLTGAEFTGWTVKSGDDGSEIDAALLKNLEVSQYDTSFEMPAMNLILVPNYRIVPSELEGFLTSFEELAEKTAAEGAAEQENYSTMLGDAIAYYQQWLALPSSEILSTETADTSMEGYQLKTEITDYLREQNREADIASLSASYERICKAYVRTLIVQLNPQNLTRAQWEKASDAYQHLGTNWCAQLEALWLQEQQDSAASETEAAQEPESETETAQTTDPEPAILTLGDLLQTYEVILVIQELDFTKAEDLLKTDLLAAQNKYQMLSDAQKRLVWNAATLIDALKQRNLWETEPETETNPSGGYDFGDGGYDGDLDGGYTASELKELIEDKEREIKECELSIREADLAVKKAQRIVDGKVVKSTLDGTVVSIGTADGNSDDDYFAKVTNTEGLYAKGAMNELELERIHVGDKISGMMMDSGVSFTAVIKEISTYPSADNDGMYYYSSGSENSNASYYPFYALLDDTTDIEEGEAEIQLAETMTNAADQICLEKYFVRTDNAGKSYVYISGADGKLKKQYVTVGKLIYGYALEILSGLELTDKIAFPYGDDVFEGAATKEVDLLFQ